MTTYLYEATLAYYTLKQKNNYAIKKTDSNFYLGTYVSINNTGNKYYTYQPIGT